MKGTKIKKARWRRRREDRRRSAQLAALDRKRRAGSRTPPADADLDRHDPARC